MNDRSSISTEAVMCLINIMSVKTLGPPRWLVQYELWLFICNEAARHKCYRTSLLLQRSTVQVLFSVLLYATFVPCTDAGVPSQALPVLNMSRKHPFQCTEHTKSNHYYNPEIQWPNNTYNQHALKTHKEEVI